MTAPDDAAQCRQQLLEVLRAAGRSLATDEIRQQLGLAGDKQATDWLRRELTRLYTSRRVEVDRRADSTGKQNLWRMIGRDVPAVPR